MAGNYPDVPAPRMAYDRDGTIGFRISNTNIVTTWSQGDLDAANDEGTGSNTSAGTAVGTYQGIIFPQLRDIYGVFWCGQIVNNGTHRSALFEWSADTTNGFDGTWNNLVTIPVNTSIVAPYRTNITSVAQAGVKGLRTRASVWTGAADGWHYWTAVHIYGSIASGQSPDRLRLWHPTLDEPLDDPNAADGAYLDWGDVSRGSTQDRTFRIKNNSATLTANTIAVSIEVPTDTTPTVATQMTLSDGGTFGPSVTIASLAPGAISPVITMRRTTPINATLSLWAGRINAVPGSWS